MFCFLMCCSFPAAVLLADNYKIGKAGNWALWLIGMILAAWLFFMLWAEKEKRVRNGRQEKRKPRMCRST